MEQKILDLLLSPKKGEGGEEEEEEERKLHFTILNFNGFVIHNSN